MKVKYWQLVVFALGSLPFLCAGQTAGQNGADSSLSGQAQMFMQMQQMQNQIDQLRGTLEEQQLLIKQMQQEGLERYQDLDKRITNAGSSSNVATNNTGEVVDANATLTPPANTQAEPADPEKEKIYYEAAYSLIQKKDFTNAQKAFTVFLQKFPNSQYAPNAQYWIAEIYLSQGDMQNANTSFSKVISQYPKNNKIPDATYKLATVQQRLGNNAKAKELLNQVVSQYPKTSAATLAKRMLPTLN